ncbi:hypothetical protein C8R43DRAFT_959216 [Mycena crocata]|nr:hypothetical protein C8R43DRAFT_959216 [Mycena crocata]
MQILQESGNQCLIDFLVDHCDSLPDRLDAIHTLAAIAPNAARAFTAAYALLRTESGDDKKERKDSSSSAVLGPGRPPSKRHGHSWSGPAGADIDVEGASAVEADPWQIQDAVLATPPHYTSHPQKMSPTRWAAMIDREIMAGVDDQIEHATRHYTVYKHRQRAGVDDRIQRGKMRLLVSSDDRSPELLYKRGATPPRRLDDGRRGATRHRPAPTPSSVARRTSTRRGQRPKRKDFEGRRLSVKEATVSTGGTGWKLGRRTALDKNRTKSLQLTDGLVRESARKGDLRFSVLLVKPSKFGFSAIKRWSRVVKI